MLRSSFVCFASLLCFAACAAPPPPPPPKEPVVESKNIDRDVAAVERAFAATMAKPDFVAYRQYLGLAQEAYGRKDYAAFLAATQKAANILPNSPRALYNVACGYALTGKPAEAISQLENLAQMNLTFPAQKDDDLASLQTNPRFKAVLERFAKLESTIVGQSVAAFSLPEKDLIPEGIVHDPKTNSFFVGSVHKRKIMRIPAKGAPSEFASKNLDAVLGMAIDEKRRALWACSSAIPEMTGFVDADKGRANVVEFDIDTGKTRRMLPLDEKGPSHMCNDLAVDADGNLFVSDPGAAMLYSLPAGAKSLEPYVPAGKFAAPQGIALTRDQKSLVIADYSRGLFHVDRATHEVTWLRPPTDATLVGIDGLTMTGDDLIAIQNGVRPHRVLRLVLDIPAKTVRKATILQMNHANFDEPTLGVVVSKEFFYVANSQWGHFNKGQLDSLDKLAAPMILKLKLD